MHQGIKDIFDNSKVITKEGDLLFRYKTTEELISENLLLIQFLEDTSPVSKKIFKTVVYPLIFRFTKIVSITPASKFLHDCDCCGLLRHSLLVAIKAVELCKINKKMSIDLEPEYVLLIFISLLHDCGKVLSDVEIFSRGITFSYSNDKLNFTLDDFLQKHKSDFVKIRFKEKRNKVHELSIAQMLKFLVYGQNSLSRYLVNAQSKESINAIVFSNTSSQYYKLIKTADIYACTVYINRYSPMY